nr:transcription factor IIIB 60 kDa subunit-like isoform X1 [Ipomoea batatas]
MYWPSVCKLLSLEEHPVVQKPVDPSLFIHRYNNVLMKGDYKSGVSKRVLQIVASMKRDWMQAEPIPEATAARQTPLPTTTSPVHEKRPYDTWMLVTKKPKPADAAKNSRQTKKKNTSSNAERGNQYAILAELQENAAPTINRTNTDKAKSKLGARQTSKGKYATTTTNSVPTPASSPPSQTVANTTPPGDSQLPQRNTLNRGGRSGGYRGRGRGSGRGHSVSLDNTGLDPPGIGVNSQLNANGIFQFGGTHTPGTNTAGQHGGGEAVERLVHRFQGINVEDDNGETDI